MTKKDVVVDSLESILGTGDAAKQLEIVKHLMVQAQSPVVTMTVVLDTAKERPEILLNSQYSFDEIYALLDIVRREVQRREREAFLAQQQK